VVEKMAKTSFRSVTQTSQIDRKPEIWKVCSMKTTLDLPEEIVREMKIRAVREGRKLRDVAREIIQCGLTQPPPKPANAVKKIEFPLIECQGPATRQFTPEELANVLLQQEVDWHHEASGR
jgi:plasmid stability protein